MTRPAEDMPVPRDPAVKSSHHPFHAGNQREQKRDRKALRSAPEFARSPCGFGREPRIDVHAVSLADGSVRSWDLPPMMCFHAIQAYERRDEIVNERRRYEERFRAPLYVEHRTLDITSAAVTDQSGAAIPGCALALTDPATGAARKTTSDAQGDFSFLQLPVGTYTITGTKDGFKTLSQRNVGASV